MNVRQMSLPELGLVKMGLDYIYVHDHEKTRLALLTKINEELARRQVSKEADAITAQAIRLEEEAGPM